MRFLRSPRWRRRLAKVGLAIAVVAPLIYLGVHYSNPGNPGNPNGPAVAETGYEQPKPAPFRPADQRAVHRILRRFIISAVARHDVRRSWDVTGPDLREGYTRKDWTGDIPVVPYPAANRGLGQWSYVEDSYKNDVYLEVFLFPKPGSGFSAMSADTEVVKGRDGKWRVNYWMPKKFHGPPAVAAQAKPPRVHHASAQARRQRHASQTTTEAEPMNPEERRQSRLWWMVPLGVLSLLIVIPLSIGTYIWYQNRRAQREYLRSRA